MMGGWALEGIEEGDTPFCYRSDMENKADFFLLERIIFSLLGRGNWSI
jgi:hypothetical protein